MPLTLAAVRRALLCVLVVCATVAMLGPSFAHAQDTGEARLVDVLQLDGPLTPPMARTIHNVVADAERRQVELLVIEIDAPAGIAVDPAGLVAPIRAATVPVVVWVGPQDARAAGSGAFLLAAAHLPAASRAAEVGPGCPPLVDRDCDGSERELLDALVEGHGAGVGLAAAGLSGEEAREAGLVGLVAEGLVSLLTELDGREVVTPDGPQTLDLQPDDLIVRFANPGLTARILHASLDPLLIYLLLMGVLVLVAFEVFQPGFGVAGIAALILLPLAVYGIVVLPVSWWAVGLLALGVALLGIDLAIAGLGVPTAAGAASVAAGSWWLFSSDHPLMVLSPWLVALVVAFCVVFFVVIMTVVLRAQAGPEVAEAGDELVGRVGVVRSTMNPEGHVFVAGALWRARWDGEPRGRIRTGTRVRILGLDDTTLLDELAEEVVALNVAVNAGLDLQQVLDDLDPADRKALADWLPLQEAS
jgi:membrane-bound serine protease (ClpP class)